MNEPKTPLAEALDISLKEQRKTQNMVIIIGIVLFVLGLLHLGEMIYNNHISAPNNRGLIHDKLDKMICILTPDDISCEK